ncbi:hypothetical protein AB6A40_002527 [Gnathostoma spinigerum]|uniref:Uncharacterized protein n=1 Tax=Gnathostoma spinigerum TaxID=75299 RepID=A0ABD6E6T9_9BILA
MTSVLSLWQFIFLLFFCAVSMCGGQFVAENYPNPKIDPHSCHIHTPGPVCDPSSILPEYEKQALIERIKQLSSITSAIPNTSPACQSRPRAVDFIVAVVEKIGVDPSLPVDIEKFTNSLKLRFQGFQDPSLCDTMVVIVNSRSDRQVFTVAGRDVKVSEELLKTAFRRNIKHFKAGHYAKALEGMVETIVAAYNNVHIIGTEPSENNNEKLPLTVPPLFAGGVRETINVDSTRAKVPPAHVDTSINSIQSVGPNPASESTIEDESDRLWVDIMKQAVARCGNNQDRIGKYVQSVVEEAMDLSLRLISDHRYNSIEEFIEQNKNNPETKNIAWAKAKKDYLEEIYAKHTVTIKSGAQQRCPAKIDNQRLMSKYLNLH